MDIHSESHHKYHIHLSTQHQHRKNQTNTITTRILLSSIRQRALTRACAYDLQPPFPRTDSGKRTFLCASILFNCLDSDCKQLAASPSCSSYTNAKQKIRKIFLNKLNLTNHIEDLFCINCKYLLNCNCIHY